MEQNIGALDKLAFTADEFAAIDEHAVDAGIDLWQSARRLWGRDKLPAHKSIRTTGSGVNDDKIEGLIDRYREKRRPESRHSSFDYCFNYFRSQSEGGRRPEQLAADGQLQLSCLQLGFYLASWGMFRGRSDLLAHSVRGLEPTIRAVAEAPKEIWDADVDGYDDDSIALILEVRDRLRVALPGERPTDTLVSKTMLGVFGCVPAFDRFFRIGTARHGLRAQYLDSRSLQAIGSFFADHREVIDRHREATLDVVTGAESEHRYTRAKVVDMIFFSAGFGPAAEPLGSSEPGLPLAAPAATVG